MFDDLLKNHGLQDFLSDISQDQSFKSLDSKYYSCSEFIQKVCKNMKNVSLSVFHLNIRSLNAKLRDFCIFMELLEIKFDVIVLSEIWSYNIDFYQNILDGCCL